MSHLHLSPRQIFSGTAAFAKESDEEVVQIVNIGMRPEWPPEAVSKGLGDAIWQQVEACWSQEPEDRPTALVVLQALQRLSEEWPQVSQEPREPSSDDTWDYVTDGPEGSISLASHHDLHGLLSIQQFAHNSQELIDAMDQGGYHTTPPHHRG